VKFGICYSQIGYDYPYMSFVYSYVLLWVVVLALCILIVSGVAYVYICGFIVDWGRLCIGFVC